MHQTLNQKIPNKPRNSRWRKVLKEFGLGAGGGAIIAIVIKIIVIGPKSFFDNTPTMIGGTNKEWSLIITSFWELIGVAGGGILGVVLSFIISQPISRKWKWIIIGIIAALIALFLLFTNTTYFR